MARSAVLVKLAGATVVVDTPLVYLFGSTAFVRKAIAVPVLKVEYCRTNLYDRPVPIWEISCQ